VLLYHKVMLGVGDLVSMEILGPCVESTSMSELVCSAIVSVTE